MRIVKLNRSTAETTIELELNLDGSGKRAISTGIGFFDHMLDQIARHGHFDLRLKAVGDLNVDEHHTVEDCGICLGKAFADALGDKTGIRRYGMAYVPMDEALARAVVDCSGRGFLVLNAPPLLTCPGTPASELVPEFFRAFASNALVTLHLEAFYGTNMHHIVEALFKAFGRALREACSLDPSETGIPSTKGML